MRFFLLNLSTSHNQLGRDGTPHRPERIHETLDASVNVVQVACGAEFSCAVDDRGVTYSWGRGYEGQLGYGSGFDHVVPRRIDALAAVRVRQIVCGVAFALALDSDYVIWSWGENGEGQLGRGRGASSAGTPTPIRALSGKRVRKVWAGWRHAGMLTEEGDCWLWGNAHTHQLGLGSTSDQHHPRLVKGVLSSHRVVDVSAGWMATVFRTAWGGVFICGAPRYAQLGLGSTAARAPLPTAVLLSDCEVRDDAAMQATLGPIQEKLGKIDDVSSKLDQIEKDMEA